jgi:large subunit ribosomal protein L29
MTGEEVRKLSDEEISVELNRLRRHLYDLRSQSVTEKLEDPTQLGKTKRDIARLMTETRAREMANTAKA